jgi:hypothetical protein
MDLSETILAAMIGALATVGAAVFQLVMAFKSGDKPDARTKRGGKFKSLLSIAALMVASAVGGFLYSEFLKQRGAEQMQAMRDELREVKELAALAAGRSMPPAQSPPPAPTPVTPAELTAAVDVSGLEPVSRSEALIYVPTCQPERASGSAECLEAEARRVALCGTIPARAQVTRLELFAQPDALQQPWDKHVATLEQDLGGARFTGNSFESVPTTESQSTEPQSTEPQSTESQSTETQFTGGRAVCVNFMHWSSAHPHLARLVVHYAFAAPQASPAGAPAERPVLTDQVLTDQVLTDQAAPASQAASFIAPGRSESQ